MISNGVVFVSNAFDDLTRRSRGVETDSPAASRKVFMLCKALRKANKKAYVLSLGRGRVSGTYRFFRSSVKRVNGVPVVYCPFTNIPVLSELLTLICPIPILLKIGSRGRLNVLFYNRLVAYFPTIVVAWLAGMKRTLDLEDGVPASDSQRAKGVILRIWTRIFDRLCNGGVIFACDALRTENLINRGITYYGVAEDVRNGGIDEFGTVRVLLSGTLSEDTGVRLFLRSILEMRSEGLSWTAGVEFHICGKGPLLAEINDVSKETGNPSLVVHGRLTASEYSKLLASCHVGLALKPNFGILASTTFPSKVIEYGGAGLLVFSTDISDVRKVFGDSAIYLKSDTVEEFISNLRYICFHRTEVRHLANEGRNRVLSLCSYKNAGKNLGDFLFDGTHGH